MLMSFHTVPLMTETLLLVVKAVRIVNRDVALHEYICIFRAPLLWSLKYLIFFPHSHRGAYNQELIKGMEHPMLCGAHSFVITDTPQGVIPFIPRSCLRRRNIKTIRFSYLHLKTGFKIKSNFLFPPPPRRFSYPQCQQWLDYKFSICASERD